LAELAQILRAHATILDLRHDLLDNLAILRILIPSVFELLGDLL